MFLCRRQFYSDLRHLEKLGASGFLGGQWLFKSTGPLGQWLQELNVEGWRAREGGEGRGGREGWRGREGGEGQREGQREGGGWMGGRKGEGREGKGGEGGRRGSKGGAQAKLAFPPSLQPFLPPSSLGPLPPSLLGPLPRSLARSLNPPPSRSSESSPPSLPLSYTF